MKKDSNGQASMQSPQNMHLPRSILPDTMSCSAGLIVDRSTSCCPEPSIQFTVATSPVMSMTSAKSYCCGAAVWSITRSCSSSISWKSSFGLAAYPPTSISLPYPCHSSPSSAVSSTFTRTSEVMWRQSLGQALTHCLQAVQVSHITPILPL